MLETLHTGMHSDTPARANGLVSDKTALRHFLESAERFNRNWLAYIDGLDLEPVNKPRRDFNQFYVIEKSCAFGSAILTEGFEPLAMIDSAYFYGRFPLLIVPRPA